MADVRTVSDSFAVAPQIRPEEVADLSRRFAALVNNRPDGEEPGQPSNAEIEAAAREAGVAYTHIPVSGAPTAAQIDALRQARGASGGPVLAFCRTGTRSIITWALGEALDGRTTAELESQGRAAGYDLGPPLAAMLPQLR